MAVALLPLAGLATFATRDALSRLSVNESVGRVVSDAELVGHLLKAKEAAATEYDAVTALTEAATYGITGDFIRDNIGIDFGAGIGRARDRFDSSVAEIVAAREGGTTIAASDDIDMLLGQLDRLEEIRGALDNGALQPSDAEDFTRQVLAPLEAATAAQLEAVASSARSLGENGSVDKAARDARQAIFVSDLIRAEGVALSQYVVPIRPAGDPVPDPNFLELLAAAEIARHEIAGMEAEFDPDTLGLWNRVASDPDYLDYAELRDQAVAGEIDPMANLADFGTVARAGNGAISNGDLTATFTAAMNGRVITEAEHVGSVAQQELRESAILAGFVGLATILGIMLLSSSIVRPLRLLEARARRINDGDLSGGDQGTGGPREIAVVDRALNELVAGLQVLETQAEALAVADLSAPALATTSPGRLGESLRRSVDQLSAMAARLDHQANHDQLTGMLNRTAGIEAMESSLARARRTRSDVALLFVDLDGFKAVNDVHGHPIGDQVLQEAAARIGQVSREADTVARLGGDEFIVVLEQVEEIGTAVTAANRIIEAIGEPIRLQDLTVSLSASIGIAWSPRGETDAERLLVQADLALYRAKGQGKARTEIFDEHLQQAVNRRAVVETSLGRAIDDDRLELWYQPILSTVDRSVWGMETLVRWRRTDGKLIAPDEFIPVAERSDLILALDRHVLAKACRQIAEWQSTPSLSDLKLSVNVSGRHLDAGDLLGDINEVLAATGARPESLVVEMTETRLVEDVERVSRTMGELRDLGIGVSIDDFGTGYSSVAHLRRIPATHLKIDRSFVSGSVDATDRSILELLAWLGVALDLEVVAEGVETVEQLQLITELGCTHAQGFLLGRPMPIADVGPWLSLNRPGNLDRSPGA